ncbi:Secreted chorismate mutase precursor [Clavibacter michiganensis subsp. michiganensis]|uniref:Secreted chorismate mutase n=1 Tax=Clavibacter michiganensis subsp. michiganensis TaxID=33013 RepID=A0A251XN53_CLAMM|nr:Secreted chorismate mutase precursor [Clavibacter michiganensis subsp. michiganensis]OUE04820.1 Secreted chorismate mutase precursor [Clavibacter michiganensis subsp. michiganensis]
MPRRALLTTSAFAVTLAALLGAAAPAQACPRDPAEQQAVAAVASAALDRLEIADDVAASKYLSGKAVADPAREQAVVDATIAAAKADGVDPVAAERIIRAQITASKQVQYALIAFWHANPRRRRRPRPTSPRASARASTRWMRASSRPSAPRPPPSPTRRAAIS